MLGISLDLDSFSFSGLLDLVAFLRFGSVFLGFGFIRGHYVFSVELMNASHFVCC